MTDAKAKALESYMKMFRDEVKELQLLLGGENGDTELNRKREHKIQRLRTVMLTKTISLTTAAWSSAFFHHAIGCGKRQYELIPFYSLEEHLKIDPYRFLRRIFKQKKEGLF